MNSENIDALSIKSVPMIRVGLMHSKTISIKLNGEYKSEMGDFDPELTLSLEAGKIKYKNRYFSEIVFHSVNPTNCFTLKNVVIGIGFHWERAENQVFNGDLKVIIEGDGLRAINLIDVESYLESVISSEMSPTASLNLLKSHAVISRSWLLYPIFQKQLTVVEALHHIEKNGEWIRWYERDAHNGFDVCADDHCQRYQGVSKIVDTKAKKAVSETRGLVLMHNHTVCDARFSKCCGGVTEEFENCWSDQHFDYLESFVDGSSDLKIEKLIEENAYKDFQKASPKVWCNTNDPQILGQVLNDFDRETNDFFRWKVSYSQAEIAGLLKIKSGIDFGRIKKVKALTRSNSGRIVRLKIIGEFKTIIIGKELEIRKWLSRSHLYSSAFYVEEENQTDGYPTGFTFKGSGWGHGVGLCQIGAAVMGEIGKDYTEILHHYYPNTELKVIYS